MHIDWDEIDTVLLDMDGTLIDRYVEDNFWQVLLPRAYAKKHGITAKEAKDILIPKFRAARGTVDWGNIDYWEKDIGLNLWSLRLKALKNIGLHPHTIRFLKFLKKHNKKIYLVTASYPKDTKIKLAATKMRKYFDGVYTQPDIGKAKEDEMFWHKLRRKIKYNNARTLLADDDETVVRTAMKSGITNAVLKTKYNSRRPPREPNGLFCVKHFDELIKFKKKTNKSIVIEK